MEQCRLKYDNKRGIQNKFSCDCGEYSNNLNKCAITIVIKARREKQQREILQTLASTSYLCVRKDIVQRKEIYVSTFDRKTSAEKFTSVVNNLFERLDRSSDTGKR